MKRLIINTIAIFVLVFLSTCSKREWDNPYDPECEKGFWSPKAVYVISQTSEKRELLIEYYFNTFHPYDGIQIDRCYGSKNWQIRYALIDIEDSGQESNCTLLWEDSKVIGYNDDLISYKIYAIAGENKSDNIIVSLIGKGALFYPVDGDTLDNGCYSVPDLIEWYFDWKDISNASKYHLYVIGPTASTPIIDNDNIVLSEFLYSSNGVIIMFSGWKWKLRAMINDQWTEWSEEKMFDVEPINTDCP